MEDWGFDHDDLPEATRRDMSAPCRRTREERVERLLIVLMIIVAAFTFVTLCAIFTGGEAPRSVAAGERTTTDAAFRRIGR